MLFSSLVFLVLFLPVFLLVYYGLPSRYRNIFAALASLFFYAWGEPVSCVILVISCLFDYKIAARLAHGTAGYRKLVLGLGCSLGLFILAIFKYADFFIQNINYLLETNLPLSGIGLPIGISFYTFQKITYLVDVYRRQATPARSFLDYILYVSFFPQLVAGPIVRYQDVAGQIRYRVHSLVKFRKGLIRFAFGLAKKVLIANELAIVADQAFSVQPEGLTVAWAWIGILAYTFQIYFDFSGYSDMALGLASMLGFRFPENFRHPYSAVDFSDFWRRWHISLSTFMRDYVYIPLGGNRSGVFRTVLNLWLVFLLSGLWHGASWNFLAWGIFHGIFISVSIYSSWSNRLPGFVARGLTFLLVVWGWVLFRSESLPYAVEYWKALAGLSRDGVPLAFPTTYELIHNRAWVSLIIASLASGSVVRGVLLRISGSYPIAFRISEEIIAAMLTILCILQIVNSSYNPFIYFRF